MWDTMSFKGALYGMKIPLLLRGAGCAPFRGRKRGFKNSSILGHKS